MPNARVGAMPQPNNYQNNYPPGRGTWRNRTQQGGGLSIEDLKRQTAIRLAQEGGENSIAAVNSDFVASVPSYQRHHQPQQLGRHNQHSHYQSNQRPQYGNMYPNPNAAQYLQQQQHDYTHQHATTYSPPHYPSSQQQSRNYTDSQLGLGPGRGGAAAGGGVGQPQQYPHMRSPVHSQQQQQLQQYGTPRVPPHESALKDRGSAENSEASEGGYNAPINTKGSHGSNNSNHQRSDDRNSKSFMARGGMHSPDGRRTPVRDGNVQGQKIMFSPNQRDSTSTPTSVYSEPPHNRSNPNSPHNMQQRGGGMRGGYRSRPKGGGHNYSQRHAPQQQTKLPHGLTVQELKEMTRARLAADAEAEAGDVSSIHSHGSSSQNGSIYVNIIPSQSSEPLTRNLVQTNDSIRHTQSYGANPMQHQYQQHPQQQHHHQQQRQYQQYPNNVRHPSPVFGTTAPCQFNGAMQSPRQISPMSDYQSVAHSGSGGTNMPFSSPLSWAGGDGNSMAVNRSRCHSAEASPLRTAGGFVHVAMSVDANRRRCLTTSPLAKMDCVNEDKPFWFSDDDKDRLKIPQLSQRRGLYPGSLALSDSAFQPIGKATSGGFPFANQRPQQLSQADRLMSMESQGHGDLPSSMAEAVLNSLTGAPPGISSIGGDVIVSSPFRPLDNRNDEVGDSPFRTLADNLLSASASCSESMFSSGESNRVILGTHSWGGEGDDDGPNNLCLSHDFSSLLNIGEPSSPAPMRGRANTDPPHFSSSLLGFPRMDNNSGFYGST